MLLGLYGMFAVGKTTFFSNTMDEWPEKLAGHQLTVVQADIADEFHYEPSDDAWIKIHDKPKWKGSREDKVAHLAAMIADRDTIWMVESARYFGGLQDYIVEQYKLNQGGVRFIVLTTTPATGRQFLIDRCIFRHKTFRSEYWDQKRLEYETRFRYTNVMERSYIPAGIRCWQTDIDYERSNWSDVNEVVKRWLGLPENKWYRG